ncbi:MAG TPA: hypothetical protein V6D48_13740, partial [Oculatellaceae cyanobacterium]
KSREVGCDDFIPKPVRAKHLLERLGVHLGLEWVYDESGELNVGRLNVESSNLPLPGTLPFGEREQPYNLQPSTVLIAPPPEDIAVLLDLAMRGNIRGIDEQAARLEQLDDQFVPFASELRQLAQGFQIKQIQEFLKPYTLDHE